MARFMDTKAKSLLEEFIIFYQLGFINKGNIAKSASSIQGARKLEEDTVNGHLNDVEKELVASVVDSFKNVVETIKINEYNDEQIRGIFSGIFDGIKDLIPNANPPTTTSTSTTTTTTSTPLETGNKTYYRH